MTSYFPGVVSAFLVSEESDATVCGGSGNKRGKMNQRMISRWFCSRSVSSNTVVLDCLLVKKSCSRSQQDSLEIMISYQTIYVGSQFGAVESVRVHCFTATNEKINTKKVVFDFSFSNREVNFYKRDIPSSVRSLTFYVKFEDAKSIEAALALNGEKYGANLLRVDGYCGKRKYSCRATVFVGNLPYDVSENELIAHFETTGNVSFVRIVRDSRTVMVKGCFCAFKESEAVPLALQLDGSIFKKRPLRAKKVQKKNKIRSQTYQHSQRIITKQCICHMQFDRSVKNVSSKKVHECGKRKVRSSIMT